MSYLNRDEHKRPAAENGDSFPALRLSSARKSAMNGLLCRCPCARGANLQQLRDCHFHLRAPSVSLLVPAPHANTSMHLQRAAGLPAVQVVDVVDIARAAGRVIMDVYKTSPEVSRYHQLVITHSFSATRLESGETGQLPPRL